MILYNIEILKALGFKSSQVFLKRPVVTLTHYQVGTCNQTEMCTYYYFGTCSHTDMDTYY